MKIAGLLLNESCQKSDDLEITPPNPTGHAIRQFLTRVEGKLNVFEKFSLEQYGELFVVSVNRDYRGQGLATELFQRSYDIFRKNGDTIIKCTATSPITRKLCSNLGFVEMGSWKFSEIKDGAGNPILGNISECDDGIVAHAILKL